MEQKNRLVRRSPGSDSRNKKKEDLSGRDRLVWNVVSGWASYVVLIVSGFVMPRLLDRHIGQNALGLWDFCWSFTTYFNLLEIGVGSSVNRHVAQARAAGNIEGIARLTSSVMAVQLVVARLVVSATTGGVWLLPTLLPQQSAADIVAARWMLAFFGMDLAVRIACNPFRGVITGCHRWGIHNGIIAGNEFINVVAMLIALVLGGGLRELGMAIFLGTVLTEICRAITAFRVCPGLRIGFAYVELNTARHMVSFGGKAALERLSRLILNSTTSFLVATFLGPAALAIYSRPGAIMRHVETLVNKFALVLSPTVGFLQEAGHEAELREFVLRSAYYGTCLTLPMTLMLTVLGGPILTLWMGPQYNVEIVVAILAIGSSLSILQRPTVTVLIGANLHGKAAFVSLFTAVLGVGVSVLALGPLHLGLTGAALGVAFAFTANAIFLVSYTCQKFKITLREYSRRVLLDPVLCVIPFVVCLVFCRVQFGERPLVAVCFGFGAAILTLGPLYWKYVFPNQIREKTKRAFSRAPGLGHLLAR
jgi:O-antigen/teichoic acid export membrane protein